VKAVTIATAALTERLCDVAVELGLRRITASTNTHTISVSEPSLWDQPRKVKAPHYGYDIEVKEHEL
jgi:hypothetical protein